MSAAAERTIDTGFYIVPRKVAGGLFHFTGYSIFNFKFLFSGFRNN